jgi:predicted AAA+ superfamily ATPase
MDIKRELELILTQKLKDKKALIIYGTRQVSKSTLLKHLFGNNNNVIWFYGDQPQTQGLFENLTTEKLKTLSRKYRA